MNSQTGLCAISVLLSCALLACSDAPEVTQQATTERVADSSVLDAARALLNQPPPGAVDMTTDEWQAELPEDELVTAPTKVETTRISTAARRAEDAEVLNDMVEFERLRQKARGSKRDQPLEVSLEER